MIGKVLLNKEMAVPAVHAEEKCQHKVLEGLGGYAGPPLHLPIVFEVTVDEGIAGCWKKFGGPELEAVLASGAVTLLRGKWTVGFAEREGSVLLPRQALPDEAFLSRGHNLRIIARALKELLRYISHRDDVLDVALFFDFCSMHQKCRGVDGKPGPRVLGFADDEAPRWALSLGGRSLQAGAR
jgi:hypothetical protein